MKIEAEISVVGLIKDDTVLLQHRDDRPDIFSPNKWTLPGGLVEPFETPIEAAVREIKEEVGYQIDTLEEFSTFLRISSKGTLEKVYVYFAIYDGVQKINCYEGQAMEFKNKSQIGTLPVIPGFDYAAISLLDFSENMKIKYKNA